MEPPPGPASSMVSAREEHIPPPHDLAGIEEAVSRDLLALSPATLDAVAAELNERALSIGFSLEHQAGKFEPLSLMLRPRVWTAAQAERVQRACLMLQSGLCRLLPIWLEDAEARRVLPLGQYEESRLRQLLASGPAVREQHLFSRMDAIADFSAPDWEHTLAFMETNVVGVGGNRYTALGEALWRQVVLPRLPRFVPRPQVDSRRLLLDELLAEARRLGVPGPPRFALVEDLTDPTGTNELRLLAQYFTEAGHPSFHVDARALAWRGGDLFAGGQPVDFVYRFPELREVETLDRDGALEPLWRAFDEGKVLPTLAGELDHKSALEVLTSPRWELAFTAEEREVFRQHVLWTRVVSARHTEGPHGAPVDLPEYVRGAREALVLKPNRRYGGDGVLLGPEATQAQWERALDQALAQQGEWVVQSFRAAPRQAYPVRTPHDDWTLAELATVSGFFATARGAACLGRASRDGVVNLTRPGASLVAQLYVA